MLRTRLGQQRSCRLPAVLPGAGEILLAEVFPECRLNQAKLNFQFCERALTRSFRRFHCNLCAHLRPTPLTLLTSRQRQMLWLYLPIVAWTTRMARLNISLWLAARVPAGAARRDS
ncbi:MAG: hypothetical protein J2P30_12855 [Actinobacteria bacterium]|nr:hypothetical protein [Actinomycetota bacterium]